MRMSDWSSDVCSSDLWMWWIFPQLAKLGRSSTAQQFAIHSVKEAQAYLDHPILGPRYLECVTALQDLNTSDADAVFGEIDAKKLRSSLTLFELAYPHPLFSAALDRWFSGRSEEHTSELQSLMRISYAVFCLKKKTTQSQALQQISKSTQ